MGKGFAANHALARELFAQASDALGYDLKRLCLDGPEDELTLTYNAQPAILTVSVIAYRLLAERAPLAPLSLAGHSLGEYSAIVAAGALDFADAVKTVHRRGKFMQEATPPGVGAMAAILGMEAAPLEALCREEAQGQVVSPANFNAPGQIVISGNAEAVKRVLARAKGRLLQVSAPFHCALLQPAADRMRDVLAELRFADAAAPVVANADNAFISKAAEFPPSLVRQVTAPVRWDSGVKAMVAGGVDRLIEVGHGTVLGGLMKRIDRNVPALGVQDDAALKATLAALGA
jgi:[acyl-carrier-protein] S-malonyltransferase